jgi:hypothetical protein
MNNIKSLIHIRQTMIVLINQVENDDEVTISPSGAATFLAFPCITYIIRNKI